MKKFGLAATPCILLLLASQAIRTQAEEALEDIAKQANVKVPGIVDNPAPKPVDTQLPWDAKPGAPFRPGIKISTQEQLDAELKTMRAKYAPFMADLAPPLPKRTTLELETFAWRYAEGEDAANHTGAAQGKGDWKQVKIPHYWGPQGPATAYYRTEVNLDEKLLSQDALYLHFNGVDYTGDVYVNGTHVGSHTGLFDAFEFDIKPLAKPGRNVILVRVGNDFVPFGYAGSAKGKSGNKNAALGGPGWDDPNEGWICCPAGFGLWQRAWLEARPAAFLNDIFVRPLPDLKQAEVWVEVAKITEPVTLEFSLYGQNFKEVVAENQAVKAITTEAISPGMELHKFTLAIPTEKLREWSPGSPWLYQIQIRVLRDGKVIDFAKKQFGMRTFVQSSTSKPKGRFYLNGREIRLRGANTMGNLSRAVMNKDFDQLRDDILIAKIAHMNFWRLTQQPGQEEVYDYFDRLGMLAQTDLPNFGSIYEDMIPEEHRQVVAMTRLVRGHPSNAVISYINEPQPHRLTLKKPKLGGPGMVKIFKEFDKEVAAVNPDQVIKWVDGDFINVSQGYSDHHWYAAWYKGAGVRMANAYFGAWQATRAGWMHACGEYGSAALNTIDLMKKYYPQEWLKETTDGKWNPNQIPMSQIVSVGQKSWYGGVPGKGTMKDWVDISRDYQKWGIRLQTEILRRDPKMNSNAMHLLIDAWPEGWSKAVVDYERKAKPAYFEFRDALTPLAVNLRPNRFFAYGGEPCNNTIWLCNDTHEIPAGAVLRYQVELAGKVVMTGSAPARITACEPVCQGNMNFTAPLTEKRQPMTLRAGLFDANGRLLHDSSYDIDLLPAGDKVKKISNRGGRVEQIRGS